MAKRGALSKIEKFFIEGNVDLPVEEIATELDRTVNAVQKHLDSIDISPKPVEPVPVKEDDTHMMKVMGRHQRAGKPVAAVMTKAASELSDAQRPRMVMNKKMQDAIHKPMD